MHKNPNVARNQNKITRVHANDWPAAPLFETLNFWIWKSIEGYIRRTDH